MVKSIYSNRYVIFLGALLAGAVITIFGSTTWTVLMTINMTVAPSWPWGVPAMGLVLWLLWQYLDGKGWPASTSEKRRWLLRGNAVATIQWKWAVFAGVASVIALAGMWIVFRTLVWMAPNNLPDWSTMPAFVSIPIIIMASMLAPVTEEAGFRGYFQVPLEKYFGPMTAIIITSVVFALVHLTHGFFIPKLTVYFLFGIVAAVSAYLTNSILPGMLVHMIVDLTFFILIWPADSTRVLYKDGGGDTWFWIHVAQVFVFGALAIWGYLRLSQVNDTGSTS